MSEDERLRDLLDGTLSSEELSDIRDDPILRSLALRIYGDGIREAIGEDPIEDDVDEVRTEIVEVTSVEVKEPAPLPLPPTEPVIQMKSNSKGRRPLLIALGSTVIAFDLFNVFMGVGSVLSTCGSCSPSRLKLNILSATQMSTEYGWSELGAFGVVDYGLLAGGLLTMLFGLRRRRS